VQPSADDASAQRALAAATTLLETPHEVVLLGHGYPIRRDALAKALDFAPDGGEVRLKLTRPAIRAEMHRLFGPAEVQPRNARFAVGSTGGVEIVDSSVGREVDADTVRQALEQNPSMEQIPVRIADIKPSFSTADAKKLGITDLVGEFTTPYDPGAPRVTNIQRAAEVLDGFILGPGETFSLNAVLGPRTIESGYVLAPQIEEGKLKDAVGGASRRSRRRSTTPRSCPASGWSRTRRTSSGSPGTRGVARRPSRGAGRSSCSRTPGTRRS